MLLGYYLLGFSDTKQYVFFKNNKYNCFTNRISSTDKFIIDLTGFNEEKDFVFILDKPSQSARNVPLLELLKSNDLISIEKAKYKDAYEIPWSDWKEYYAAMFRKNITLYDSITKHGTFTIAEPNDNENKCALVFNEKYDPKMFI